MKLLVAADLHLTHKTPFSRKDNYGEACLRKLNQLVDKSNELEARIIVPGDFFDSASNPVWFINAVIKVLRGCNLVPLVIAGNHDLKYHVIENLKESSLWNLKEADVVEIHSVHYLEGRVYVSANNYTESPCYPKPEPDYCNILVMHTPVFETVPFFMPDADTPKTLEMKYPGYDYYLVGDIHQTCITDKVINTGSMMRMTRAQKDHKPCFVELDTDTGEKIIHYFEIEEDVWKTDFAIEDEDGFAAGLQELSEVLVARGEKLSYKETVVSLSESETIKKRFTMIMEGYNNG